MRPNYHATALVVLPCIPFLLFVKNPTVYAIPVRAHVLQFLLHEFGAAQPHPLHQNSFLGRVVQMKVEKHPFRQLSRAEKHEGPAYQLTLPTALKHHTITPESAKQMGKMLDKYFQEQMIMFVKGQVVATQNERLAIRSFCQLYDIDPSDADLEMLRKCYRDYKDKVLKSNGSYERVYSPEQPLFNDYAVRD